MNDNAVANFYETFHMVPNVFLRNSFPISIKFEKRSTKRHETNFEDVLNNEECSQKYMVP